MTIISAASVVRRLTNCSTSRRLALALCHHASPDSALSANGAYFFPANDHCSSSSRSLTVRSVTKSASTTRAHGATRLRQRRSVSRRWPRVLEVEVWVSPRSMASNEPQTSAAGVLRLKKAVPLRCAPRGTCHTPGTATASASRRAPHRCCYNRGPVLALRNEGNAGKAEQSGSCAEP